MQITYDHNHKRLDLSPMIYDYHSLSTQNMNDDCRHRSSQLRLSLQHLLCNMLTYNIMFVKRKNTSSFEEVF